MSEMRDVELSTTAEGQGDIARKAKEQQSKYVYIAFSQQVIKKTKKFPCHKKFLKVDCSEL
jgi:hypothetical protein